MPNAFSSSICGSFEISVLTVIRRIRRGLPVDIAIRLEAAESAAWVSDM